MIYKVIEHHADGTTRVFGWFETRRWAEYHIAQAKATSGLPGYVDYTGVKFEIVEVKS